MKQFILTLSFLSFFFCFSTFGQLQKGDWIVGGGMAFSHESFDGGSQTEFGLAPRLGHFVLDNFVLGTELNFSQAKSGDSKQNIYGVAPFARYYLEGQKLKPFLHLNLDFDNNKFKFGNGGDFKQKSVNLFGRVGFNYFLSPNVALETSLNIKITDDNIFGNPVINEPTLFLIDGRVQFGLSINFFLNGQNTSSDSIQSTPIKDRYLKKNNRVFNILSAINVKDFLILGSGSVKTFNTDRSNFQHLFSAFLGSDIFSSGLGGFIVYGTRYEHYLSLSENTFFTPSFGPNLAAVLGDDTNEFYGGFSVQPKLTHFLSNFILELGIEIQSPFFGIGNDNGDDNWNGSFILAGEYFIQNNLSVRGAFQLNAFGEGTFNAENVLFITSLPSTYFSAGFSYFFEKKMK